MKIMLHKDMKEQASCIPKAFGSTFGFAPTHEAHPSAKPKSLW